MSRSVNGLGIALIAVLLAAATQAQARFIQFFNIIQMNGPAWHSGDEVKWAKYAMIDVDRHRYNQITSDTYGLIHSLNPTEIICIYQQGPETSNPPPPFEPWDPVVVNDIGRYNVSRGHSMGNLNTNNPGLFLLKADGTRCHTYSSSIRYLMDFGSDDFIRYWVEATVTDLGLATPWHGDGIFVDNCAPLQSGYDVDTPVKYNTDALWQAAMMKWHTGITAGLHANGLQCWTNSGCLSQALGYSFYTQIDSQATPPDIMSDEAVFVHGWGSAGATFYDETKWKRQVDIMAAMQHVKLAQFSHVRFTEGGSGTDNFGKSLTYWDALWYAMGSFCLGMNDQLKNSAFFFENYTDAQHPYWYDEYDKIDLGSASGAYQMSTIGTSHVYWREFAKGYVFRQRQHDHGDCAAAPSVQAAYPRDDQH